MYLSILSSKQIKLLEQLGFLKKYGFYLAGGTALALHIGHRTSLDFDFYTEKKFDALKLGAEFERRFKKVTQNYLSEDTLEIEVEGVKMSFFRYIYKLLNPLYQFKEIRLVSLEDIAAMKIVAIAQRGNMRDFIDIYFLIKKLGLKEILNFTQKKYPHFNNYVCLQGLTYFADAEKDEEAGRFTLIQKVSWKELKKFIVNEVNKYTTNLIKK
ncbi:MAG: nucleotidyl transferase AbiEii/AbiGii toxin family protein [Candidatus Pacebacteria bacterium]|nr:nucleotidyl transferase AbiEii/AbiGii toxin family protein [Candidatus Paceibacterota bacterium]